MSQSLLGLTTIKTPALEKLLRHLYRKEIHCPLNSEGLATVGLQYCQEGLLGALRTLDEKAITAVLICVIAERRSRPTSEGIPLEPSNSLIGF